MDESLVSAVRERAAGACEYCQLADSSHPGPFEIEHVIPIQHGGPATMSNLAFSCLHCNRHKGPNVAGIERVKTASRIVPLYHPRRHKWSRHFRWDGATLVGRTPIGRVTIRVLAMNAPLRLALREELFAEGLFPPSKN